MCSKKISRNYGRFFNYKNCLKMEQAGPGSSDVLTSNYPDPPTRLARVEEGANPAQVGPFAGYAGKAGPRGPAGGVLTGGEAGLVRFGWPPRFGRTFGLTLIAGGSPTT